MLSFWALKINLDIISFDRTLFFVPTFCEIGQYFQHTYTDWWTGIEIICHGHFYSVKRMGNERSSTESEPVCARCSTYHEAITVSRIVVCRPSLFCLPIYPEQSCRTPTRSICTSLCLVEWRTHIATGQLRSVSPSSLEQRFTNCHKNHCFSLHFAHLVHSYDWHLVLRANHLTNKLFFEQSLAFFTV